MNTVKTINENLFVEINDITICYNDSGSDKHPIIFVHGFPFNKKTWHPQFGFFSQNNRVITYDIRGFGKSTSGTKEMSMSQFADDLVDFMSHLEIEKAIVCGLSMGGYILLNAVNRYPEKFSALVLCDTQCIADSLETKEKRQQSISNIPEGGLADFTESFIKNIFLEETLKNEQEMVDKIRNTILATSVTSITTTLKALADRDETCSMLQNIKIPTLIICGKEDKITPPLQAQFLKDGIAHSTLSIIEDAAHLSNLEKPDVFNKELANFISKLRL